MRASTCFRPRRVALLPLCLGACLGATAQAQDLQIETQLMAQADAMRSVLGGLEGDLALAGELGSERVVKGAPYCAEAVHESVQWLQNDGSGAAPNRIVRQQSTRLCRDGEGRTRQEVDRGGRKLVYLRDPVSRESWVLDPERKTARRLGMPMDAGAWREYSERMRDWARATADQARAAAERARSAAPGVAPPSPPTPPTPPSPPAPPAPPTPPTPVVITHTETGPGGLREAEVRLLRLDGGAPAGEWMLPPAVQWRAQSLAPRGAGSTAPLAPKDIEGVRANGERTTWVIEAGKIGNEKPIQIVREVWTAPELMVTVLSRDFDPRSGEQNYRLRNLKRGEPDAALMRVPADYTKPAPRPAAPRASGPTG